MHLDRQLRLNSSLYLCFWTETTLPSITVQQITFVWPSLCVHVAQQLLYNMVWTTNSKPTFLSILFD